MEPDVLLDSVFSRLRAASTFEEAVERLGVAIRAGMLPAGSRLPAERLLAEQLGISRSTLRQALTALVQSGHLVAVRGRGGGTFVTDSPPLAQSGRIPLPAEARAVLDLRVAIEVGSAVLASERGTADQFEQLGQFVDHMAAVSEAENFDSYRRADIRFHIGIADAAHSPRLVSAMSEVQAQMSNLITLIAHPPQVLHHSNEQHRELVHLLRARETAAAVLLMRHHTQGTEHILVGLI